MKVVILAGGYGTRLAEFTDVIPKPMVPVGGKPILLHIMQTYASRGFNEFILALGYKADVIKQYFLNYASINSDFTVSMNDGSIEFHNSSSLDWKVTLVDTGLNTLSQVLSTFSPPEEDAWFSLKGFSKFGGLSFLLSLLDAPPGMMAFKSKLLPLFQLLLT